MGDLRLDKWLWAARFFRSRSQATAACDGGKVDVNEQAAKPARVVRVGDLIRVSQRAGPRIVRVLVISDHRGSGTEAAALYEDLTPPRPRELRLPPPLFRVPGSGRPTKRDRRLLDRLPRF